MSGRLPINHSVSTMEVIGERMIVTEASLWNNIDVMTLES
jgi:hypothetical protein